MSESIPSLEQLGIDNLELSAPVIEELYVDLAKRSVYGFELAQGRMKVRQFAQLASEGVVFPAVPMIETRDGGLALCQDTRSKKTDRIDGGHHRALAHFIAEAPLRVAVLEHTPVRIGVFRRWLYRIERLATRSYLGDLES